MEAVKVSDGGVGSGCCVPVGSLWIAFRVFDLSFGSLSVGESISVIFDDRYFDTEKTTSSN